MAAKSTKRTVTPNATCEGYADPLSAVHPKLLDEYKREMAKAKATPAKGGKAGNTKKSK